MKKFTHRLIPLVLCFTLTLGTFAYRPPKVEAITGVDDAVVIGALLTAFAGGMGLIFSNNGMTSGQIANGMADKWNEYNQSVNDGALTFAGWLGYDSIDDLWSDIKLTGKSSFTIPVIVARRLAAFTKWFAQDLGVTAGGEERPAFSSSGVANCRYLVYDSSVSSYVYSGESRSVVLTRVSASDYSDYIYDFELGSPVYSYADFVSAPSVGITFDGKNSAKIWYDKDNGGRIALSFYSDTLNLFSNYRPCGAVSLKGLTDDKYKVVYLTSLPDGLAFLQYGVRAVDGVKKEYVKVMAPSDSLVRFTPDDVDESGLGVQAPSGVKNPALDDENATPALSGVGWDASTIEELLQQILTQVEANTLAPTLEGVDTDTGGDTGTDTDEDAKPYLPYIPRIFEKIGELPTLIAEKIGAFFTTLWGWLQKVIDAIVSIPAAVAEKVGELFKPDETLVTEITDTFKGKFGFFATLKKFGSDLFGMTAETEPPVIWVHLENAESRYGYVYGDKQKMLDLTWYQKYKPTVDGLLSGFLWLGYLWLLFKRAPSILNGMSMEGGLLPPLQTGGDVIDAPRIGSGDPSMHYGDGFTFRDKGGRRK